MTSTNIMRTLGLLVTFLVLGVLRMPGAQEIEDPDVQPELPLEEPFILHMPAILQIYPRPEGYDYDIAVQINNTSYDWIMDYIYDLVELYSPRHDSIYQRFTNFDTCNLGGKTYNLPNLQRSLNYVESLFSEFGFQISRESVPGSNGAYNLIAYKPASAETKYNSVIEVGAHLDAVSTSPGASDNAAGVAGVLEIARLLQGYPNQHPWRLIAFVEEEDGILGSYYHVQNIRGKPFKSALVMDTIGWSEASPNYMNCIYAEPDIPYTVELANLFNNIRTTYGINIGWRRCSTCSMYSDQGRYWQYGLPAVLSVGGLPYKAPTYHKCSDHMGNLNRNNVYLTIQENVGVLLTLDKEP